MSGNYLTDTSQSSTNEPTIFSCNVCNIKCLNEAMLKKHFLIHSNEVLNVAKIDDTTQLNKITTESKPVCKICFKCFISKKSLRDHLKQNHADSAFFCGQCNNVYATNEALDEHVSSHHSISKFVCEICNRDFSYKLFYDRHKLSHLKYKPFACDICHKAYFAKSQLRNHRQTHSTEKPHVCKICGKGFPLKSYLRKHSLVHTEGTSFSCEICGKSFVLKRGLYGHLTKHEKRYFCNTCNKGFATVSLLKNHQKYIHREQYVNKFLLCEFCFKRFSSKQSLQKHYQRYHEKRPICEEKLNQSKEEKKSEQSLNLVDENNLVGSSEVESYDCIKESTSDSERNISKQKFTNVNNLQGNTSGPNNNNKQTSKDLKLNSSNLVDTVPRNFRRSDINLKATLLPNPVDHTILRKSSHVEVKQIIEPKLAEEVLKLMEKKCSNAKSIITSKTENEEKKCIFVVKDSLDIKNLTLNNKKIKVLVCEKSYIPNKVNNPKNVFK